MHLCNLFNFLENTDIASHADDNTICSAQKNRETVINTTETSSQVLFDWFSDNFMKANSGKSHLLMSGTETAHANVDGSMIKSSQKEILLGINLDSELKFADHVNFICKKVDTGYWTLIHNYLSNRKQRQTWHRIYFISWTKKIWDLVPRDIKFSQYLSIFKRKIKKWVPLQCPCRLCKIYLQHVTELFMVWSFS